MSYRAGTWANLKPGPTGLNTLVFSSTNFREGAPSSGTISGATLGSVLTLSRPLAGLTINSDERTWAFDGRKLSGFGIFMVLETLRGHRTQARHTAFKYTNLAGTLALGALGLSSASFTAGTASSGTITGVTIGSTIAVEGQPSGFTINSAARTWSYDGSGSASSGNLTLTEILSGATNSPRASEIGWTVAAAPVVTPTLGPLGLSSSSFTVGTPSSGTISGATAGSTIALSSAPAGFTINSAARTWAFEGTGSATTGNLSLTETLAGATNNPRVSSVAYTVAASTAPATLDPTLSTPVLIDRTSGGVIAFDAGIESDYGVGDKVYLIAKNKAGTVALTFSNTIDAAEATDTSAGTNGRAVFSGLSAVSLSTTYRWSLYIEKAGGATYGPSSATVVTGPDDQEPSLSAPTSTNIGATFATIGVTTDDGSGIIYWVVTTSATVPSKAQIKAGQDHTGAMIPAGRRGSAAPSSGTAGAKTFSVSGTTASTAYHYYFMQEDASTLLNQSNIASGTYTSVASDPSFAKLVNGSGSTGAGINRSRYIVSTDFTATATGGIGVMCPVKSADAPPPKFHFEITLTAATAVAHRFQIGVTDAATNFDDGGDFYRLPGDSTGARPGSTLRRTCGGAGGDTFANGSGVSVEASSATVQGDIFSADVDRTTNTVVYKRKRVSDGAVETIGTYVLTSQIPTDWRAFVGVESDEVTLTVNFGASAFAITPLSDHTGW